MSYYHITSRRKVRRGFTLIELLVVIVIIGILASLMLVGGNEIRKSVRRGIIKVQIAEVEMALTNYQNKYGEYPPDFSDEAVVMRHVRKRWPNWQGGPKDFDEFCRMVLDSAGYDFHVLTAAELPGADPCEYKSLGAHLGALAFWLGGIPDSNGLLNGFSADVSDPLGLNSGSITQRDKDSQFMELTIGQNCEIVDGLPVITANGFPIAYFKPNAAGKYTEKAFPEEAQCVHVSFPSHAGWDELGIAQPYAKKPAPTADVAEWHNPKSYQLIHPGLDGNFGGDDHDAIRVANPGNDDFTNCTTRDRDNQTNFGGTTIESAGK